jgi:signal transduction histidine kinase/integral membrane sensor domain MASE1
MNQTENLNQIFSKKTPLTGFKLFFSLIIVTLAYFAAGKISLILATMNSHASPFWPASGIALASVLIFGKRISVGIFLGSILTNMNSGIALSGVFLIALVSMLESWLCYYILQFLIRREVFKTYFLAFGFFISGFISCLVSSALGFSALYLSGLIPPGFEFYTWFTWWGGNFVGIMVFTPFVTALFNADERKELLQFNKIAELIFYFILIWFINEKVFKEVWEEGFYWLNAIIFLIATLRINSLASRILFLFSSLIAILYTMQGHGPFEFGSPNLNLIYLQIVVLTFSVGVLFMNAFKKEDATKTTSIMMVTGLLLISFGINRISADERINKLNEFQSLVSKVKANLDKSESHYKMLLKSSGGLVSLFPEIDAKAWRTYTNHLDLKNNYSAINALSTIQLVEKKEIPNLIKKFKSQGISDFALRDIDANYAAQFDNKIIVTNIEPFEKNKPARGLNLGSEKNRREAAEAARKLNQIVATKPIQLVQDNIKRPGFLVFNPVWLDIEQNDTVIQKFWGWTDAPVVTETFFNASLGELQKLLNINLFIDSESVYKLGKIKSDADHNQSFYFKEKLKLFNVEHELKIYPTEQFFENHKSFPVLIGVLLTALLILLSAIISQLGSFASKLASQVKERTAELDKERLKSLQNSKLVSLGELSAGIAHEINNPLAIISGSVGLIPDYANKPEKLLSKVDSIKKSVERISRIIGGLKKFSRSSETVEFKNFSVSTLIEESIVLVEHKAKRFDTNITLDCQSKNQIFCNEVEIEQVLINLLSNAIDAVKDLKERWVKINAFDHDDQIVIQVIDSGAGISKEHREKIFDPFYTTKKVGEGTGLGLSISKGILDEHKASIKILDESVNTCFEIRFPKPKN